MFHTLKSVIVGIVAVVSLAVPSSAFAQGLQLKLSCPAVPMVIDGLVGAHVGYDSPSDELAKRAAKLYAERIDPTQVLLTQSEFRKLEKRLYGSIKNIRKGNCEDFRKLKQDQVAWQKDLETFVRKLVADGKYEIDKKRTLDLDPEKRQRPKTAKERDELRRALVDFQMANYLASGVEKQEALEKLVHRYELFTRRVEEQKEEDIYGTLLNAYANALDPHSTYFSPDDMEDFKIQMGLSLTGIGAVLSSRDGLTVIEEIVPGGAADRHGKLQPKDQIIAVAQGEKGEPVDVIDMRLRDVVKMIRGKKGTKVRLTVLRKGGESSRMTVTIERDVVDLKEQAAKLHWQEVKRGKKTRKIAIIDLPSFYQGDAPGGRDSARDVAGLLARAKAEKADAVVLDVSRNGGGSLESAVTISGLFIESGGVVGVAAPNHNGKADVLEDKDPKVQWDGPLVIVTSKISASASEILAGTLQDYRRAVVVGDPHTYGKGSVQQLTQLPPGLGLLKVTTALFFLPAGESTQSTGVTADVVIPSDISRLEIGEKHQDYAMGPVSTGAFLSPRANASKKWTPVTRPIVERLRKSSEARVAKSKEFQELQKKLAEEDPNDTRIEIAEILSDGEGSEKEEEETEEDDELSLQVLEATQIAADLVALLEKK